MCEISSVFNSIVQVENCIECEQNKRLSPMPYFPVNALKYDVTNMVNCSWDRVVLYDQRCEECEFELFSEVRPNSFFTFHINYQDELPAIEISLITNRFVYGLHDYSLKAKIAQTSPDGGHFMAHIRRNDSSRETYDDLRTH